MKKASALRSITPVPPNGIIERQKKVMPMVNLALGAFIIVVLAPCKISSKHFAIISKQH